MSDNAKDASLSMDPTEFQKVYHRMLELELELVEFQESSKDLEQALEDELHDLEAQKSLLTDQLRSKEKLIFTLNGKVQSLNNEVAELLNLLIDDKSAYEKVIADLKHKLVAMEILNDDYLSRDRVVDSKLQLANQFNNELLEKLAMVENDLDLERQTNAHLKLTLSNLGNTKNRQASRQTRMKRDSTYTDFAFAESTVLDINEMLATEPPAPVMESKMPRSESLTRFQELCTKSDVLRQKVGEVNSSLALKSLSTAEISRPTAISFPSEISTSFVSAITDVGEIHTFADGGTQANSMQGVVETEQRDDDKPVDRSPSSEAKIVRRGTHSASELKRGTSKKFKLRNVMKSFLP